MSELSGADGAGDDDLPNYQPPFGLDAVPGFCDRLVEHLIAGETAEEFTFEGVDVEAAEGVWMLPLGGYDPDEDASLAPGAAADESLPSGGYAQVASTWAEGVRRVLRETWGDPLVRTPQLVGEAQEPEGLIDFLLVTLKVPEAEMWDRGDLFCVLMTSWDGEPGASMLRQALVVLPREFAIGGMSALVDAEGSVHELLMHGEHLLELRRRAWLMSTLFGAGEVRLRDTALEASRFSLQARDGTTTVWTFADDGRALLLVHDPASAFATSAAKQFLQDHALHSDKSTEEAGAGDADTDAAANSAPPGELDEASETELSEALLILVTRMLDGVPQDLRDLIPARAENARGEAADHAHEFRMLGDRPLPVISGAAWFDGEHWRVSGSMIEIGHQNDFGMDDFGFAEAVRRPYRLGGSFSVDNFISPGQEDRRAKLEQLFNACPYPEQPRPTDDERLGKAVPSNADHSDLVQQIEQVTETWWEQSPDAAAWGDYAFHLGDRRLTDHEGRVLTAIVGTAESWTVDALEAWAGGLMRTMSERWGPASEMQARDQRTGTERRTPLTRVMRGTGLLTAPMWWVNGHAVSLLAGMPDPDYSEDPQVILVLSRADAVLDIMRGTKLWELRLRTRAIGNLGAHACATPESLEEATDSVPAPEPATVQRREQRPASQPISWDGPPLEGSVLVPDAVRGGFRTGDHFWVWHFTHDGRGLLMSHPVGAAVAESADASFIDQVELFAGVPHDLLSLVIDRDPDGLYEVVTREGTAAAATEPLAQASSLPAVQAVFWHDDVDWRASDGMLRRARAAGIADAAGTGVATANPLATIYSEAIGVPQLHWALRAGDSMDTSALADVQRSSFVFDRTVEPAEVERAFEQLGNVYELALTGSLNDLLDVIIDTPGDRFLLDAALSNPNPRHRREIALWLLGQGIDASIQLSFLTPINVLFENPTLGAGDTPVLRQLLRAGAEPGAGLTGAVLGGHPLAQLANRDADESELVPLYDALLAQADDDDIALADGSLLEYVEGGTFPHRRSRTGLLARLREIAALQAS